MRDRLRLTKAATFRRAGLWHRLAEWVELLLLLLQVLVLVLVVIVPRLVPAPAVETACRLALPAGMCFPQTPQQ